MNTSKKIRVLASLGIASGAVWSGTFATFGDTETASDAVFTTGTVDLQLDGQSVDPYAFASFTAGNLKPGDVTFAKLDVKNNGTLPFTYTMATGSTDADAKHLNTQLRLGVRAIGAAATCDQASYDASGDVRVGETVLNTVAATAARPLAATAAERLCFRMELPSAVGDSFQAATTTATFTFTATQS